MNLHPGNNVTTACNGIFVMWLEISSLRRAVVTDDVDIGLRKIRVA
jgi:hypothetical protein